MSNLTECDVYLLHIKPYRNTSVLLTAIDTSGRLIHCSYRGGVKKNLQLFTPYWMSYQQNEGLSFVKTIELISTPHRYQGSALFCALYVNELITRLLRQYQACPDIFSDYQDVLNQLERADTIDVALRRFERKLLRSIGFELSFAEDSTFNKIDISALYIFSPEKGFIRQNGLIKGLNQYLGEDILLLSRDNYALASTRQTAKQIMRQMFHFLLNGKVLQSRKLFEEMTK